MSYLRDIDEYEDDELRRELDRRAEAVARGVCDYCGRRPDDTPCRFGARHAKPRTSTLTAEEREELARGRVISAIKLVRQRTGLSLVDAKRHVDRHR